MSDQVQDIPLDEIICDHDFNCRGLVAPIDVMDLVKSLKEHGLLEPITVQPWTKVPGKKYRIVMGHRRFTAHRVMGASTIKSFVREGLTEIQARTLNLTENLQRKQLNILQESKAISFYKSLNFTQEETATLLQQPRGWVQIRFMVLDLPEDVQQEVAAGILTQTQIRDIHGLPYEKMCEIIRDIKQHKERGEKPVNTKAPKKSGKTKRERRRVELFEMMELIITLFGTGLQTRLLSWAAAEISDFEIQCDIMEEAKKHGKRYVIPREYLNV